jgi:hypothetical protein
MGQINVIIYLVCVILVIILIVGLLPLFDPITSIFIILLLFGLAMTLLYFRTLFSKKNEDFDE